jgi:macrolide transport system ATP-binding/permease protein
VLLAAFCSFWRCFNLLISCRGIKKSFGEKLILNRADLDISEGDRIGLVGRNGSGKTTLANILTGNIDYDEGQITTFGRRLNIGYLRQAESQTDFILYGLDNETEVNREFQRHASHLGMNQIMNWSDQKRQSLSGGEKTKLALAKVWASQPDMIILDEPTNHMDYKGVNYLISELSRYQGAAIIISHDRYFLDQTVSRIAAIENGIIVMYPGNYSWYREARQKERESQLHTYQSQQKQQQEIEAKIARLKGWSDKAHRESRLKGQGMGGKEYFRKKAKKRDQAVKSQINRLEKMRQQGIVRPEKDLQVKFAFNGREKGGRRLLEADSISKAYGRLQLFANSSFYINRGEKVGILGPNGCGKTTLLKIILGQETLDAGSIFLSPSARVAYVSQELPQDEKESLKAVVRNWPLEQQKSTFDLLVRLGIAYDRLQVALGNLSRGERMKIALGLAIMGAYDLLVLDEPTNHLDLYSRESLEESLSRFSGTIILVSHDRYLLNQVCDHTLVFENEIIRRIEGNVSSYLNKRQGTAAPHSLTRNSEEKLLLETRISWILGELSRVKPGEPDYLALEQEYQELVKQKNSLK